MTWAVCHVPTGLEPKVTAQLVAESYPAYCPMTTQKIRKPARQRGFHKSVKAAFPGYTFVSYFQILPSRAFLLQRGIIHYFLKSDPDSTEYAVLPDDVINALRDAEKRGELDRHYLPVNGVWRMGDVVTVPHGPFGGRGGTVTRTRTGYACVEGEDIPKNTWFPNHYLKRGCI